MGVRIPIFHVSRKNGLVEGDEEGVSECLSPHTENYVSVRRRKGRGRVKSIAGV